MKTYLLHATPLEFLALWRLDCIASDDIQPIAMNWLESGLGAEEVACMAFNPVASIRDVWDSISKVFVELGVDITLSQKEALWLVVRFYLRLIDEHGYDEFMGIHHIIAISYLDESGLFDRPDCDAHFGELQKIQKHCGSKFMNQEYGVENLVSYYYETDYHDALSRDVEIRIRTDISSETKIVLKRFYSKDSFVPEYLKSIQERL